MDILEESIGVNLSDGGFHDGFLDLTLKHKQQKKKTDKLDFSKMKNFCTSQHHQYKRQILHDSTYMG